MQKFMKPNTYVATWYVSSMKGKFAVGKFNRFTVTAKTYIFWGRERLADFVCLISS